MAEGAPTAERRNIVWHELVERVDAYATDLELGVPVNALSYIEDDDPDWVRRTLLTEFAKVDMAHQRRQGRAFNVERYISTYPEVGTGDSALALMYEEYQLRHDDDDDAPTLKEFERRFPEHAPVLGALIDADPSPKSTSILRRAAPPRTDELQFDDFERIVQLGQGAFGEVFLARQQSMQRLVALKITRDVNDESRTLAQLDHPNIVRVFDQRQSAANRVWLMYMEFLPGGTLSHVRARQRELPRTQWTGKMLFESIDAALLHAGQAPVDTQTRRRRSEETWAEVVCRIGADMARALDYAHGQGTLHRDVKPGNILLTADGSPKLADFNTSFCSSVDGARPDIFFGGTLPYMAPEQLRVCSPRHPDKASDLDGRADIYGLAVVMWTLLFGERPFGDDERVGEAPQRLEEMIARRRKVPKRPPGPHDPVAIALSELLRTALAFDKDERIATGQDLAYRLQLVRDPAAREILDAPDRPFGRRVMTAPFFFLTLIVLAPNILGSLMNIIYNAATLEEVFAGIPDSRRVFDMTVVVVNATFFPVGIAYVRHRLRRLWRAILVDTELRPDAAYVSTLARDALRVGHHAATVSLLLWLVAGVTFPVTLMSTVQTPIPSWVFPHFFVSIGFCGLMSASYPYFAASLMVNRSMLPWIWRQALAQNLPFRPQEEVKRQRAVSQYYLAMAAGAPLLALLVLAPTALWWRGAESDKVALLMVIVAGVIGLVLTFVAHRRLHQDWDALMSGRTGAQPRD